MRFLSPLAVLALFTPLHAADPLPVVADVDGQPLGQNAALLVYSTEAGKREATLGFDVGQGTQDLGFRGEAPVLFDVKPAIKVKVGVKDETGKPTVGRFTFTDQAGHVFPPRAKRVAPDFFFQDQVYRPDGGTVLLPAGEFTMTYGRGPEYKLMAQKLTVPANGDAKIDVKLERW